MNDPTPFNYKKRYHVEEGDPIREVKDALAIASSLKIARNEFALYRGQSDAEWILRPAAFRYARWYRHERDIVRDLISTHPQEFADDSLMLDRLVRMQHYGLPTRLLDVSQNLLVALYFACDIKDEKNGAVFIIKGEERSKKYYDSDAVSLVSNLSNLSESEKKNLFSDSPENSSKQVEDDKFNMFPATDRLLQFVRNEKPYFRSQALKSDLISTFFVLPKKNNRRIIAQSGAFLVFGLVDTDRSPDLSMFEITRHLVPEVDKEKMREELEALGISINNLFPEIDHAASYLAEKYRTL